MVLVEGRPRRAARRARRRRAAGPAVEVVVRQPAARGARSARRARRARPRSSGGRNRLLLSPIGPNSPRPEEPAGRADLEQPVAVVLPAATRPGARPRPPGRSPPRPPACGARNRGGRPGAVTTGRSASRAARRAPASRPGDASRAPSMRSPTRSPSASREPEVRGTGRRRRRRVDPLEAEVPAERRDQPTASTGCGRPVVDDDHLVVVGVDAALAAGARASAACAGARGPCRGRRRRR